MEDSLAWIDAKRVGNERRWEGKWNGKGEERERKSIGTSVGNGVKRSRNGRKGEVVGETAVGAMSAGRTKESNNNAVTQ